MSALPCMKILNHKDLIEAGYELGDLGPITKLVEGYEARGIGDAKYALKLLKRDFGAPAPKLAMRDKPAPLAEAIVPATKEEKANVAAVRARMGELLRTPVIARGAIMPTPARRDRARR